MHFDAEKLKRHPGDSDSTTEAIDPACLACVTKSRDEQLDLAALCEAYSVLADTCGEVAGWWTGCPCHDYIWTQNITPRAKILLFRAETRNKCHECWRRGRRANELARGYWRTLIRRVQDADSRLMQERLAMLSAEARATLSQTFRSMKADLCEELFAKWCYWDEFPHCTLGIWPKDSESQGFAKKCLEKWDQLCRDGVPTDIHRLTYRWMVTGNRLINKNKNKNNKKTKKQATA